MSESKSSGIGFFSVLGLIFVVLKLTKNIDWSWWWVLSPFLIPIGLLLIIVIIAGFLGIYDNRNMWRR